MDQFLKVLSHRRAVIQNYINDERARPAPDQLKLTALKKLRLRFRDQIELIERMNRSGEIVPIPVVRRRSFRHVFAGRS